jgi:uncharacterized membrane protein YedE/YeeE
MRRVFAGLVCGIVFGLGLAIAGMTDPRKIAGFLDVAGVWDPSLALTMAGALAVTLIAFPLIQRRGRAVFDEILHLPTRRDIDTALIVGSGVFGIGWGLGGYCPGPGFAALSINPRDAGVFVVAMIVGMLARRALAALVPAPAHDASASGH